MNHIFAARLGELRSKANLSQKELAVTLKVTAATLSNYENGIYLPPLEKACILAKEFDCSLDYLCGLTDANIPFGHWKRTVTPQLNFYQLVKILLSLKDKELTELVRYAEYIKYRRRDDGYLQSPQVKLVAEEAGTSA